MSSNKFEVWNVNDELKVLSKGVMKVTSTNLIHNFNGNTKTIKWSMKHLRCMGCEGSIFYFEAGRKCETGEGLYAFKCERASDLYHMVCTRCGISEQFEHQSSVSKSLAETSHRSKIRSCSDVHEPPVDHEVGYTTRSAFCKHSDIFFL